MTSGDKKSQAKAAKQPAPQADDLAAKVAKAQQDDGRIAQMQATIDQLTQQVAKLTDMAGRAQAELQNAKLRMEREGNELKRFAGEAALRKLLPAIDNFQRALKHLPQELSGHEWCKGIVATQKELMRVTGEMGLKTFGAAGEQINPDRHEVLLSAPGPAGTVVEVLEDGYEFAGKVIRPAKVKAGSGA